MAKHGGKREEKETGTEGAAVEREDTHDPNTVKPTRLRPARRTSETHRDEATIAQPRAKSTENSIRPSKRRAPTVPAPAAKAAASDRDARGAPDTRGVPSGPAGSTREKGKTVDAPVEQRHHVPEHIRQRFVQVGRHFHFPDGARAFTDRGGRLTTPSENTEVIRSLVTIAEARGWSEITVRGTERFRREAWQAARIAGLEVRGYRPTAFEQSRVVRMLAGGRETPEPIGPKREPPDPARREWHDGVGRSAARTEEQSRRAQRRDELITGTLVDHGRATYRHDPRESMSYFVKIETARGDRTIWGVDLERALRESLTRPEAGDAVGLRAVREDAVTVRTPKRDADGNIVARKDLATHRNRWIVEKRAFFEQRAEAARTLRDRSIDPKEAVKRHPELVGTYLQVRAAELAARRFRDPQDRERFVRQVRSALAEGVARGEPLPPVRLRERTLERASARARPVRVREDAQVRG